MSNIQFNSKEAKNFRTLCEKYYNARHSIKSAMAKASQDIANAQKIIDSDNAELQAITDGTYAGMKNADYYTKDIEAMSIRIADAKAVLAEAKKKYETAYKNGLELYTKGMHSAATEVVSTFGSEEALAKWRTALAESMVAQGVIDATAENVARFDFVINVRQQSAKNTIRDTCLIGTGTLGKSAELFCDSFVEYLTSIGIISPFKHKFIPDSLKKNQSK